MLRASASVRKEKVKQQQQQHSSRIMASLAVGKTHPKRSSRSSSSKQQGHQGWLSLAGRLGLQALAHHRGCLPRDQQQQPRKAGPQERN